jgi:anaerobic magnesium-protoporphyrin IX monomethyl ester cyclase
MKSITFINPPSAFLLDERVFVSLGILKVAAVLKQAGRSVNFLDLSGVSNYLESLEYYLNTVPQTIIGITATTPQLPAAIAIVRVIRKIKPHAKIILGGPHVTLTLAAAKLEQKRKISNGRAYKAKAQLEAMVDVLCPGDGEMAIWQAIQDDSPSIVDGDDPKLQFFMNNEQYDASPWPARELVDMASYHYSIEGFPATSLIAQLGCPFACGFCGGRNSKALRVIRTRSSESIISEVEMLHKTYGYTGFMFYDDELNVNPTLVELMNGIADLQERLGTEFRLRGFVKSELFNKEQAEAMYRAGFRWLLCGYESAAPRILTNINKRATLEDNTRCVETAKEAGLKVKALMSIGHPGESEETVTAVRNWLLQMDVEDFDCTVITPYPGSPYYDEACLHGDLSGVYTYTQPKTGDKLYAWDLDYTETADYYKGDPEGGYKSFVFTDYLKAEELVRLRDWVEKDVRKKLDIPFNPSRSALRYEHSMGQGLPDFILKTINYRSDVHEKD